MENNIKNRKVIREEKISKFNPNENGLYNHGIFGLPFLPKESELVIIPIPWEATVSYIGGTASGPEAILKSSQQIDLYDPIYPDGWKQGIAMLDIPSDIFYKNKQIREKVEEYLLKYSHENIDEKLQKEINKECGLLNNYVKRTALNLLNENKFVGIVGGDHSVALGFVEALSDKYDEFGILQIDAHSDLRQAYEGLEFSHASISYNFLKNNSVKKIVQIGVRDISFVENETINSENYRSKISVFTDYQIKKNIFEGSTWSKQCDKIIKKLPKNVHISFDIDGLMPSLCPNSGTPVPGGFSLEEIVFLFERILSSGKKIIGFDLCEVAPGIDEWDGNVGARVLYKLCLSILKNKN